MKSMLIKSLVKSKQDETLEIDELIDNYLAKVGAKNRAEAESFAADLLVMVMQKIDGTDKAVLMQMIEAKISSFSYGLDTSAIETIHTKTGEAVANALGASFVLDKTDAEVLQSMYRSLAWMQEDGTMDTQEKIKAIIAKALEGNIDKVALGATLREEFAGVVKEGERYFTGVADHIIRQSQSLTRAYQFNKAGVKLVKVVAVMDNRTSAVCLSLNGRIIKTDHLLKQADAISSATTIEEKKSVSRWQSQPIFGRLEANVGLPPYHFRCRSIVVAFFPQTATIDGKRVNGSLLPGEMFKGNEVLFSHQDRFGYERVVTAASLEHDMMDKYGLTLKQILSGLNTLTDISTHAKFADRVVAYSKETNLRFVFRDGEVYTVYKPDKKIKKHPLEEEK